MAETNSLVGAFVPSEPIRAVKAFQKEQREPLGKGEKQEDALIVVVTDSYLQAVGFEGTRGTRSRTIEILTGEEARRNPLPGNVRRMADGTTIRVMNSCPVASVVTLDGSVLRLVIRAFTAHERVEAPDRLYLIARDMIDEMMDTSGPNHPRIARFILSMGSDDVALLWDQVKTASRADQFALTLGRNVTGTLVRLARVMGFPQCTYLGAGIPPRDLDQGTMGERNEVEEFVFDTMTTLPFKVFRFLRSVDPSNPWGVVGRASLEKIQVFDLFGQGPWGAKAVGINGLTADGCREVANRFRMCWERELPDGPFRNVRDV